MKPKDVQQQYLAQLDQDWAQAREFVATSSGAVMMTLTDRLAADDPTALIAWMKADPRIADVVQRLALLAMHQATKMVFDAAADK